MMWPTHWDEIDFDRLSSIAELGCYVMIALGCVVMVIEWRSARQRRLRDQDRLRNMREYHLG